MPTEANQSREPDAIRPSGQHAYVVRNLAVNRYNPADPTSPPRAPIVDPKLINPWGSAIRAAGLGGHFWLANQGSSSVTTYVGDVFDQQGRFVPLFQDALKIIPVDGSPVGQVFSASGSDFQVTGALCSDDGAPTCEPGVPSYVGQFTGPSRFIVNTEEGKIAAWTEGTVSGRFGRMRSFVTMVDNSARRALYRGLAIAERESRSLLYAADFAGAEIEVYDSQWRRLDRDRGALQQELQQTTRELERPAGGRAADPEEQEEREAVGRERGRFHLFHPFRRPRDIPENYVPFNVQTLGRRVYVAYAERVKPGDPDFDPEDPIAERACEGCGYVAVFNQLGIHLRTLEGRGRLNAPWGLAIAPRGFGRFSDSLLVGNFGDGTIVAFDRATGRQLDHLRDARGQAIKVDGLWAIFFGNGASLGRADYLYFTAGPNEETDGIFGSVNWAGVPNPSPTP
jgi:hypothetical protein